LTFKFGNALQLKLIPLPPSLEKRRGRSWIETLKVPFSLKEKGI